MEMPQLLKLVIRLMKANVLFQCFTYSAEQIVKKRWGKLQRYDFQTLLKQESNE